MTNNDIADLERQVHEKSAELQAKIDLLERYTQSIGRDRWYNRGCQDVSTLRGELKTLQTSLEAARAGTA